MEEAVKRCFKCGEIKSLSAFYKHSRMADGHLNKCKECTKLDTKSNRLDKIEYYQDYDRNRPNYRDRVNTLASKNKARYSESPEFRQVMLERRNKWCSQNKNKRSAHQAVNNAIRNGSLSKPQFCSCCGNSGTIQGHHWSYDPEFVLDVVWLCPRCHGLEHKRINSIVRKGDIDTSKDASEVLELLKQYIKDLPLNITGDIT